MITIDRNIFNRLLDSNLCEDSNLTKTLKYILNIDNIIIIRNKRIKRLVGYYSEDNNIVIKIPFNYNLDSKLKSIILHEYIHHLQEIKYESKIILQSTSNPWFLDWEISAYAAQILVELCCISSDYRTSINFIISRMRNWNYIVSKSETARYITNVSYDNIQFDNFKYEVMKYLYHWSINIVQ